MISTGLAERIEWGCLNRFDKIKDAELISRMAEAGMTYMYLGLELYDEEALRRMKKDITKKRRSLRKPSNKETGSMLTHMSEALKMLKAANVLTGVSILFGLPKETKEVELRTIEYVGKQVAEGSISLVSLSLLNYHLGSSLTDAVLKQRDLDYRNVPDEQTARQLSAPWNCFEEGGWFDASLVNGRDVGEDYMWSLLKHVQTHITKPGVLVRGDLIEEALNEREGPK